MPFIGNKPTAVPLTSADIADSIITSAKIADGAIVGDDINSTFNLTGKTVTLPSGVGGKVLQVVQAVATTAFSTTSSSLTDITGMSATITPSSASNKILIHTVIPHSSTTSHGYPRFVMLRGATQINLGASVGGATQDSAGNAGDDSSIAQYVLHNTVSVYLDSPSTTSSTTYKWQTSVYGSRTHYFFVPQDTGGNTSHTAPGTITLMEIAG
jgi:hypothetical protein